MAQTLEIVRENRLGMKYLIREISNEETVIQLAGTTKALVVKTPFPVITSAWFKWQILDYRIQEAFHFLSDDEREFILSGMTSEEWNRIFPQEDQ